MSLSSRRSGAALAALATVGATLLAPTASFAALPGGAVSARTSVASGALQCTAGLSPTLAFDADASSSVALPASVSSPAGAASNPAGYGINPSAVGAHITVTSPGLDDVTFGLQRSGPKQGMPWNNAEGDLSQGSVDSWYLKLDDAGRATVTITYDKPVFGMRTAITDLDNGDETMTLNAYTSATEGAAIPLDVQSLTNPDALPSLAPDHTHDGNTAYIVDDTSVRSNGDNSFTSIRRQNNDDKTGAVYFAFDSDKPVQRVEMSYDAARGRGFFFAPPSVPQACVQPNLSTDTVSQGATATLTSTITNRAGSGRINDVDFDYQLPDGVRVADDPRITADACTGTVTAVPGSSRVSVRGADAAAGASACDFSIDLVFDEPGTFAFTKAMITGASNLVPGSTQTVTMTVTPSAPALEADLTGTIRSDGDVVRAGDTIRYDGVITNTGDVALTGFRLARSGLDCAAATLAPGESTECRPADHVLTQADVDGGRVVARFAFHAVAPDGAAVSAPRSTVHTAIIAAPAVAVEVDAELDTDAVQRPSAGDRVDYRSTVTNRGNVTVSGVSLLGTLGTLLVCHDDVAPGATVTCLGDVPAALTQQQIDAGAIVNTVSGTALTPTGAMKIPAIEARTSLRAVGGIEAEVSTIVRNREGLESPVTFGSAIVEPGDGLLAEATITNTGNVTLSDVTIDDQPASGVDCGARTIAPGQRIVCTSTQPIVITEADIAAGQIEHTLVASASLPRTSNAPTADRVAIANGDDEGLRVRSTPIRTVTGLTHLPGLVDGQLGHHLRGLVATGVGPAGAVGAAVLALFAGLGGVLVAKRRASARAAAGAAVESSAV